MQAEPITWHESCVGMEPYVYNCSYRLCLWQSTARWCGKICGVAGKSAYGWRGESIYGLNRWSATWWGFARDDYFQRFSYPRHAGAPILISREGRSKMEGIYPPPPILVPGKRKAKRKSSEACEKRLGNLSFLLRLLVRSPESSRINFCHRYKFS